MLFMLETDGIEPMFDNEKRLLSVDEFAGPANISPSSVRRLMKEGTIPFIELGFRKLIPSWYLDDLLKRPD
tara:strand:+ start:1266 stop:1478 length:213 start_codon:yes stop_codon:yes gene_type:complete